MFNPIIKLVRAVKERGWKGTAIQLYLIGDLKFGKLKGTDKFGNKYYENLELPYGQHRWVEYSNIHNYDASMIQPEWHGWMHHTFDETPEESRNEFDILPTNDETNAIFGDHIGKIGAPIPEKEQVNQSLYRQRGYKVGSLMTGENDPDSYYLQPGHPLSPDSEKGRFKTAKGVQEWVPGPIKK